MVAPFICPARYGVRGREWIEQGLRRRTVFELASVCGSNCPAPSWSRTVDRRNVEPRDGARLFYFGFVLHHAGVTHFALTSALRNFPLANLAAAYRCRNAQSKSAFDIDPRVRISGTTNEQSLGDIREAEEIRSYLIASRGRQDVCLLPLFRQASARGPFSRLWLSLTCFQKKLTSVLSVRSNKHDKSPTATV